MPRISTLRILAGALLFLQAQGHAVAHDKQRHAGGIQAKKGNAKLAAFDANQRYIHFAGAIFKAGAAGGPQLLAVEIVVPVNHHDRPLIRADVIGDLHHEAAARVLRVIPGAGVQIHDRESVAVYRTPDQRGPDRHLIGIAGDAVHPQQGAAAVDHFAKNREIRIEIGVLHQVDEELGLSAVDVRRIAVQRHGNGAG